jgi:hypothetical protein
VPVGTLSLVATLPFTGTFTLVAFTSTGVIGAGAGSTKICKVALAQLTGVPPHTSYTTSTGPEKPGAGVKVYVPFGFIVNVPWDGVGPVITAAVKAAPDVLASLPIILPDTVDVPPALATTLA